MGLKILALAIGAVALTGCASMTDYSLYAQTQQMIAQEKAKAEIARYEALKEIAKTGDPTAQVAAVITLNQGVASQQTQTIQAPTNLHDTMLKWASILVPGAVQVYGIGKNTEVAITSSNNNKDIAINNNDSMVNMGRLIAGQTAPVVGTGDTKLVYPEPTVVTGTTDDVVLYPR
jgi:hypothetical protein